jgi:hypothetical protein
MVRRLTIDFLGEEADLSVLAGGSWCSPHGAIAFGRNTPKRSLRLVAESVALWSSRKSARRSPG